MALNALGKEKRKYTTYSKYVQQDSSVEAQSILEFRKLIERAQFTSQDLKAYVDTLDDTSSDEWYGTTKTLTCEILEDFLLWLDNSK